MSAWILIVDDDDFYQSVTQALLEHSGYQVGVASDGLQAWSMLDSNPSRFDLVLLDKNMPEMNGIALLKKIKADTRFETLAVIMLTGANSEVEISEGLAAGAYYYLTKPTAEDTLNRVIKNVLAEFRLQRELRESIGVHQNNLKLIRTAEFGLKTLSEAQELAMLLADLSMDASRTLTGYFELLVNAIEHGNLNISYDEKSTLIREDRWQDEVEARLQQVEYAARRVTVNVEKTATECIVMITDQGKGFDWNSYVGFTPERAFDLHGRGIAMSKAMSFDALEYLGCGNRVKVTVRFH